MAIKFDEKSEINNLFGKADDVAVDFTTLDGKTHRWVFPGGGRFLLTEFQRYALELVPFTDDMQKAGDDAKALGNIVRELKPAMARFKRAWKANVKCDDNSPSEWIDQNLGNLTYSTQVLSKLMTAIAGNDDKGDDK